MKKGDTICYSLLEYRPDPARPTEGRLGLGVALEFTTARYWVVGLAMRATIEKASLDAMDRLTKDVLENRVAVVAAEIQAVLELARQPGDVLRLAASRNPWSISIGVPVPLKVPAIEDGERASVERILEEYVFHIFTRQHAIEDRVSRKRNGAAARRLAELSGTSLLSHAPEAAALGDVPQAWMLPTKSWIMPRLGR